MAFELFTPTKKKKQVDNKRSETVYYNAKIGKLSLRKKVVESLLNPDFVKLYYDNKEGKVALETTTESDPSAIKVTGKTANSKSIMVKRFVNHFALQIPEKTDISVEQEDNMVIFNISKVS